MTVKELFDACEKQIIKGNANKEIFVSKDEEGNAFVPILYGFNDSFEDIEDYIAYGAIRSKLKTEDIVLLG